MILLDTHTLLWWLDGGEKLSKTARAEISSSRQAAEIYVSAMSVWEVAMLVKENRVAMGMSMGDWVRRLEELEFVTVISVNARIAFESVFLPEPLHNDPADRIIIATARELGAKLVTKDKKILDYSHVRAVW